MLDKKVKRKWIKALRSGKYTQGQGTLKDHAGQFCCLGVLADVQGCKWGPLGEVIIMKHMPVLGRMRISETGNSLVGGVWGLDGHAIDILVDKNDSGLSFRRIATWIEKNL